jgi:hypothetical protein
MRRTEAATEIPLGRARRRAGRFHLGIGPRWLACTYVTPVRIATLRMDTPEWQVARRGGLGTVCAGE